eukprot:1486184-Rhodomonas_salina.1
MTEGYPARRITWYRRARFQHRTAQSEGSVSVPDCTQRGLCQYRTSHSVGYVYRTYRAASVPEIA